MATISRPESPELDASQMLDLKEFLSKQTPEQLKKHLHQTITDAETDQGPYSSGGTPANVTRAHIAIQDALEQSTSKK